MYLVKDSGRVTATLTATNYPRGGTRWVQMDNNFSLQNILIALFGEFFPPDS
jgi:Ni/Co efflux regulator RcnB